MSVDIFDFWADVPGDARKHPADRDVLARSDHGRTLITLRGRMLVIEAWDELLRASEFDPTYLQLERRAAG